MQPAAILRPPKCNAASPARLRDRSGSPRTGLADLALIGRLTGTWAARVENYRLKGRLQTSG
jgi:hypothetical protein